MKTLRLFILLTFAVAFAGSASLTLTNCTTSQQVQTDQTLLTIGTAADSAMTIAAGLYHNGQITTAQWQTIATFHDAKFLPAYNTAVAAFKADMTKAAPADVIALSAQLAALVAAFQK